MRKKRVRVWNGIALLFVAIAVLVLTGCPQEAETVFSDDAGLESIKVNDVEGTLPSAIPKEDWENPSFDISSMSHGYVIVVSESVLEDVTVTVTTSHGGAKVQYGQGTNSDAPVTWNKSGRFYGLSKNSVLYVTVMSESGVVRNFYKVRLLLQSDGTIAALSRFEVNGSGVRVSNVNADIAQVIPDPVWVDSAFSMPALITAVPANENATVTTALVKRGNDYGNAVFYDATSYEVDDGDVLYAKSVSFDETETLYYAATIRIYNHITLTIGGKPVEIIGQGGEAGSTANFGSVTLTSAEAAAGAVIHASPLAGSSADVTGYQINNGTLSATWVEPESDGSYTRAEAIPNANYLIIRIEDKFQQIYYYRVYILVQSSGAALASITVGGVNATALGTPQAAPWAGTDYTGTVIVPPSQAAPNATSVVTTASTGTNVGATGSWAKAADVNAIPADTSFSTNPIAGGLAKDQYLFVKAVSQDGSTIQYYKILVSDVKNNVVALDSITIASVAAGNIGTGGTAVNVAAALRGALAISPTLAAQTGLMIKATPTAGSNAAITGYAVVASNNNNPTFTEPDANGGFTTTAAITNGQHLFVRVQAENKSLYYYRIVITVLSANANLTAITVGGMTASSLGTPQSAPWAGTDNTGTVAAIPIREAAPNATSVAVTSSASAAVSWAKAAGASATPAESDFKTGSVAGGLAKDQYLFVKAVSSDGTVTQYYKILIGDVKSDVVNLESITIGSAAADSFGSGGTVVNVGSTAGMRGAITIPTAAGAVSGARIVAAPLAGSSSAITGYAVVASNNNNPTFTEPDANGGFTTTAAIATTNHLFIRVQAEIGTVWYYRIVITVFSDNANLTAITIGGVAASSLGTPQNAPWAGTDNTGTAIIPISAAVPNNTSVATTASQTNAVRTWAVAANAAAVPAGSAFSSTTPIEGGLAKDQYLFVKSVSQDGTVTQYYKILISDVKSNVTSLTSVTIGSVAAGSIGTGGTAVNVTAANRGAITLTSAQAAAGVVIKAAPLAGSSAAITGYAIAASNATNPTFTEPDGNGEFTTTADITNAQHLFIRVRAEIGTLYYYRIVITVQ